MYELIQVGENTFYMDCPTKVGFYRVDEKHVVLIDSGSDKDAAKKVKKILDGQGWIPSAIYNTHSHADHIGGNQYLQVLYHCPVYASEIEDAFTSYTILEPTMLYGGCALKGLQNKFLMAKESSVSALKEAVLPEGFEIISLPGHSYNMVGFKTKDDVVFLADALSSVETLEKYKIGYLYDVGTYLETLEKVKLMQNTCFVPAHAAQTDSITELAQYNIDKTKETAETILGYLEEPLSFDALLARVFDGYELTMTLQQCMLIGSTVKLYLTYLYQNGKVDYSFENQQMLWKKTAGETN